LFSFEILRFFSQWGIHKNHINVPRIKECINTIVTTPWRSHGRDFLVICSAEVNRTFFAYGILPGDALAAGAEVRPKAQKSGMI
jgi:hypothetical protein